MFWPWLWIGFFGWAGQEVAWGAEPWKPAEPTPIRPENAVPLAAAPVVVPPALKLSPHALRAALIERAVALGWPVAGIEDPVFGQGGQKVRFVLGGTVEEVYDATWNRQAGTGMDVRWELRDQELGSVVYRVLTRGFASGGGDDRFLRAFRSASDSLLAREGLALALLRPIAMGYLSMPACDPTPSTAEELARSVVEVSRGPSVGRGVLVSPEGHVWTAAQVLQGSPAPVEVTLSTGIELQAEILELDAERDIALLRVAGSAFPCRPLWDAVGVGAQVQVGATGTLLQGTIRASRNYDGVQLLQIDGMAGAPRGAPVFDRNGSVVGIVSSRPVGDSLSFVVPSPVALDALRLRIGDNLPASGPLSMLDLPDPPIEPPVAEICLFRTSPGAEARYVVGRFSLTLGPGQASCLGVPKGTYAVGREGGLTTQVAVGEGDKVYVRVLKAGLGLATPREYDKLLQKGTIVRVEGVP